LKLDRDEWHDAVFPTEDPQPEGGQPNQPVSDAAIQQQEPTDESANLQNEEDDIDNMDLLYWQATMEGKLDFLELFA
jgi:hypothetical protein